MFGTGLGRLGASTVGLLAVSSLLLVSVVMADALVVVNVRNGAGEPADGKVTLVAQAGGKTCSCQTREGKCEIPAVVGGNYTVSVVPNGSDQPTAPRAVMIPPSGKVSLIVSTVAAP